MKQENWRKKLLQICRWHKKHGIYLIVPASEEEQKKLVLELAFLIQETNKKE